MQHTGSLPFDLAARPAPTNPVFYVEGRGTGVPVRPKETRRRKGKQAGQPAKTREVKSVCVFTLSRTQRKWA